MSLQVQEDVAVLREFGVEEVLSSGAPCALWMVWPNPKPMASGLRVIAGEAFVHKTSRRWQKPAWMPCTRLQKAFTRRGSKLFDTTGLVDYDLVCDLVDSVSDL